MGAAVAVVGAEAEDDLTVVVGASTSFWIAVVVGAGFASSLPPQEVRSQCDGDGEGCNDSFHRGIKPDRPVVTYTSSCGAELVLPSRPRSASYWSYQVLNMCAN